MEALPKRNRDETVLGERVGRVETIRRSLSIGVSSGI